MPDLATLFGPADAAALALLVLSWAGIGLWIETGNSVTRIMSDYRRRWMAEMVTRQPRVYDATVLNGLRQGTAFFASTSILAIGGVLALVGNTDPLSGAAETLGEGMIAPVVWQIKLLLVAAFLVAGFLKFVWANRVYGYCAVVMSAVPNDVDDPEVGETSRLAAELNIRAAINFNRGLRAMYFALPAMTWLLGPLALALATAVTVTTLWRREFASFSRKLMVAGPDAASQGRDPG